MKNDRFDIVSVTEGDILTSDPCRLFSQSEIMHQEMSRGLRASLDRSDKEWALSEPVKSATNQIDFEVLAHYATESNVKVKNQIAQAYKPELDRGYTPDGPTPQQSPRFPGA